MFMILMFPIVSFSQSFVFDIGGQNLSILNANRVLVSGTAPGFTAGSVHRYNNILTINGRVLYGLLTVVSTTNAIITNFDDETVGTGTPIRFQPVIETNAANGVPGFVTYNLEFFDTATNFPVYLSNFYITGVDVDGISSDVRELYQLKEFTNYQLNNPTGITTSAVGQNTQFLGISTIFPGIAFNDSASFIAYYNNPKTSIQLNLGCTGTIFGRQTSMGIGVPLGTFTTPVTTNNATALTTTNLDIVKNVDNYNPIIGSNIVFNLKASNLGTATATNVIVGDKLPSGYSFVSATPSVGTYNSSTGVWSIGNLAVNASATLDITVLVNPTGNYTNEAGITGDEIDPITSNNSSSVVVTPQKDSDGDGVGDLADLDDDNDGILDTIEGGPQCVESVARSINTVPFAFNSLINSTTTTPIVNLNGLANGSMDFRATLVGNALWRGASGTSPNNGGGIQLKNNSTVLIGDYIYMQPVNTSNQGLDYANYELIFPTAVTNLSFNSAGLTQQILSR